MRHVLRNLDRHVLGVGFTVFGFVVLFTSVATIVPSEVRFFEVARSSFVIMLLFTGPLILVKTLDRRFRRPLSGQAWSFLCANLLLAVLLALLLAFVTFPMLPRLADKNTEALPENGVAEER